jgi:F420-non-reducing hydrogenase small subunit
MFLRRQKLRKERPKLPKKKLAVYTATGCLACENAVLDIHYQVASLSRWVEVSFWPYLLGSRWEDLEEAGSPIDVCLFAGAIGTEQDREAAVRLREKSKLMVACGACAAFGGMPGLANLAPDSLDPSTDVQGELSLPGREPGISGLAAAVKVDYYVPGCPPTQALLWAALQSLVCDGEARTRISFATSRLPDAISLSLSSGVLPPHGSVFAGEKAVCASCSRVKEEKKFTAFQRPYQIDPDAGRCLLEQGLICQGLATREGCGGLCTAVGAGCRGCFGKAEAIFDPGAKMVSAISSTFDSTDASEIEEISSKFVDLSGTFYRYTLPTQCALMSASAED